MTNKTTSVVKYNLVNKNISKVLCLKNINKKQQKTAKFQKERRETRRNEMKWKKQCLRKEPVLFSLKLFSELLFKRKEKTEAVYSTLLFCCLFVYLFVASICSLSFCITKCLKSCSPFEMCYFFLFCIWGSSDMFQTL